MPEIRSRHPLARLLPQHVHDFASTDSRGGNPKTDTLESGAEMPREFVSKDDLAKKLKGSLEAEGLGHVGLGPVRTMIEIGLSGENWWVNVIKSLSANLRRDAEDLITRHQKRHSVERRSVERRTASVGSRASLERSRAGVERRAEIRRGPAS